MDHRVSIAALPLTVWLAACPALAQTSPLEPSFPQPIKPDSPVVEQIAADERPSLTVRKQVARRRALAHRSPVPRDLDRPALAGVELVAPLPPPDEPPHIVVPMPAYSLDSLVTAWITPPPPIVCHRTRRDVDAPDPHLYRETPVTCEPDNP